MGLDQPNNGAVVNLGKSLIGLADRIEWLWLGEDDDLVGNVVQRIGHRIGRNGYCDDQATRSLRSYRGCGCQQSKTRRDAVVDEDHRPIHRGDRTGVATVHGHATPALGCGSLALALNVVRRDATLGKDLIVDEDGSVFGYRTDGDLFVGGVRQLARGNHVQLGAKAIGDRGSDNYAAARDPKNQRRKQPQPAQALGEGVTSRCSIAKNRGRSLLRSVRLAASPPTEKLALVRTRRAACRPALRPHGRSALPDPGFRPAARVTC